MTPEAYVTLVFMVAIVLLSMIPAVVLFKYLPSSGSAEGTWHGQQFKFGGAFAGYAFVFLSLLYIRPGDTLHFHVWTVTGSLHFSHAPTDSDPNVNDVLIRFVPPRLSVMNQGRFSWEIPVTEDAAGNPQFPDLQLDLREYYGTTLPLGPGRYGSEDVPVVIDKKARTIRIGRPVVMERLGSGPAARAGMTVTAIPIPLADQAAPAAKQMPTVASVPLLPGKIQ